MACERREFLKSVFGGAAAATGFPTIVPSSALGADGAVAPSDRIVVGCIGVGSMGGGHVRSFVQHPDVRVAAICDVQENRLSAAKNTVDSHYGDKGCSGYSDFRELLARKDIDAVMMAPPEHWHSLMGIEAARQGKSMYLEKPIAISVAEAKALRETVRRTGVVFQEGCQQRSDQMYRHTCELIWNGRIGQLQTVMIASALSGRTDPIPEERPQPVPEGLNWDMWLGPAPYVPYTPSRI